MMIGNFLNHLGKVILLLRKSFSKPENFREYWRQFMVECASIGIGSLPIVIIISIFLGMVMTIQTSYQMISPLIPKTLIAGIVRDSIVLELSPTVICIVLAGVVGSRIASEIGNMKVSEQIDALEIMGLNTRAYLVLPKILASLLMIPGLIVVSITLALVGGALAGEVADIIPYDIYLQGLVQGFKQITISVAMIKATAFAFSIATISCYYGYNVQGGSIEIGKSSTKAVVVSCVTILAFDYLITSFLL